MPILSKAKLLAMWDDLPAGRQVSKPGSRIIACLIFLIWRWKYRKVVNIGSGGKISQGCGDFINYASREHI